jgi:hypothetical protein
MATYPFLLYIPTDFQKEFYQFKKLTKESSVSRVIVGLIKDFMNVHTSLHIPTLRKVLELNPGQVEQVQLLLNEFENNGDKKEYQNNFG